MIFFKQHIVQAEPYKGGSIREESGVTNDFHKLSSNENPLGPLPLAMQAIRQICTCSTNTITRTTSIFAPKTPAFFRPAWCSSLIPV